MHRGRIGAYLSWIAATLAAVVLLWPDSTAAADASLSLPVAAGQSLKVVHGYNDPLPGEACVIGSASDHCGNQRYGLDLEPSNGADRRVFAPLPGRIAWISGDCLGITTEDSLNLSVCHFDPSSFAVTAGGTVARGALLGNRSTTWIHLSLDDRNRDPGRRPVPFNGVHAINGVSFDPDDTIRNTHHGRVLGGVQAPSSTPSASAAAPSPPSSSQAGTFTGAPIFGTTGYGIAVYGGGTIESLEAAAKAAGASGAWVQDVLGAFHLLIVDGPAFLRDIFKSKFPAGLNPNSAVTLNRDPTSERQPSSPPPPSSPAASPPPMGPSEPTYIPNRPGFPTRIETTNAVFFGDLEMPEPILTRWAQVFEQAVVPTLTSQTGLKRASGDPKVVFLIYGARKELGGGAVGLVGSDEFGDFIGIAAAPTNNLGEINDRLMRHEFFHFAAGRYGGASDLPQWLNEGLAFVLSFADEDNIDTSIGDHSVFSGWQDLGRSTFDVSDVRALPYGGPQIAAAHNLLKSHGGVESVRRYFRAISTGLRHAEAFSSAFGISEPAYSAEFSIRVANERRKAAAPVPGKFRVGTGIVEGRNANWYWNVYPTGGDRVAGTGGVSVTDMLGVGVTVLDGQGQRVARPQLLRYRTDGKMLVYGGASFEATWTGSSPQLAGLEFVTLVLVPGATGSTTITITNLTSSGPDLVIQYPLP